MTHRQRILADRLIAVPAAFVYNGIARLLGKCMRRDHSVTPSNVKRIVVAKLIGMGSILQATPLMTALKRQYPDAILTFVTMRSNGDLVNRLSCVDECLLLDDRNILSMALSTAQTIAALIRRRADLYFDLEIYSGFASLLALWAVTRNRIGFYRHSVAFKKGIYTHLVYFNTRMPVRRLYLQLGRVVGVPSGEPETIGPIRVDDEGRSGALRVLSGEPGWQPNKPYIVINPNASELLLERRWPPEFFAETLVRLVYEGYQIVLAGIRGERPYVQSLIDRLPTDVKSCVTNTAGRLNLGELLALLESAACVLTNDSGPMHMAIALQRPTVCLFGPASPEHYGQQVNNVAIFYARVFCSPCVHETDEPPCHGDNVCMQLIQPEPVFQAVLRLASYDCSGQASWLDDCSSGLASIANAPDGRPLGVVVRASVKQAGNCIVPECIACSSPMVPARASQQASPSTHTEVVSGNEIVEEVTVDRRQD
jgi:ADP-heptose:LPS heptosyltransferase